MSKSHLPCGLMKTELGKGPLHLTKRNTKMNGACVSIQVGQIERVFAAASHQKVWDHFTKAQRKNISMWKKQAGVCKSSLHLSFHWHSPWLAQRQLIFFTLKHINQFHSLNFLILSRLFTHPHFFCLAISCPTSCVNQVSRVDHDFLY